MTDRKTRNDKKAKVLIGLSNFGENSDHDKLQRLAISTGMTKTKLAEQMVHMCLNNESIVEWFQNSYGGNYKERYRIKILKTKEGIEYI